MNIGTKIRKLRESYKISQPELASILDISQAALCNIESGTTKKIDFLIVHKLCKHFKVALEYFIEGNETIIGPKSDHRDIVERIEQISQSLKVLKAMIST
jgi:transcriptional regulator with XRE-family HTH domain